MDERAPTGLKTRGKTLWRGVTSKYDLRPDELIILEDACRESDLIMELEKAFKSAPMMVEGVRGQDVINPIISELRQHRATVKTLLASLKLPDETGRAEAHRSAQARAAVNERWRKSA